MSKKTEKTGRNKRSHRMYDPDHPHPMERSNIRHRRFPPRVPSRFMLGRMKPQMMRRDHIYREMKDLFILSALDEEKDGLSGTQLQELHGLPRGNLMRSLVDLEKQELIVKNIEKIYTITEKGRGFLEELKEKIAERNMIMDDIAPMEHYASPFHRHYHQNHLFYDLEIMKSKEELIDYFRGIRARISKHKNNLQHRLKYTNSDKKELDILIQQIESADESSIDEIKKKIREKLKKRISIPGEDKLD